MSDVDPSIKRKRVSFEVAAEHLPGLLQLLGDFAIDHDIRLSFTDATKENEAPRYNPERVEWIIDPGTQEATPIVTKRLLKQFERDRIASGHQHHAGHAERVWGAFSNFQRSGNYAARPFIMHYGKEFIGFYAATLPDLSQALLDKMSIAHMAGEVSGQFLHDYCERLFISEATE